MVSEAQSNKGKCDSNHVTQMTSLVRVLKFFKLVVHVPIFPLTGILKFAFDGKWLHTIYRKDG